MAPVDVRAAFEELGLGPSLVAGRVRSRCPFCPADKAGDSLSADPDGGGWLCHRCGETGNVFTLRRRLRGASSVKPPAGAVAEPEEGKVVPEEAVARLEAGLAASPRARAWLEGNRRIPEAAWREARLGFDPALGGGAVAIPYFLGGRCVGVKYRRLEDGADPKYLREPGCVLPLYGQDSLEGKFGKAVVVEGELDRITLLLYGCPHPVVSLPDGASAGLKDAARQALVPFDELVLAHDSDEAGDKGALKMSGEVGRFRCRRARLPRKDANDCLKAGVPAADVLAAIDGAAPLAESSVKPVGWNWKRMIGKPGFEL